MRSALLGLTLLLLAGCGMMTPHHEQASSTSRDEALSGHALFGDEPLPPLPSADILGVSDGMRQFLKDYVDRRASSPLRLHQLAYAVINRASFGLQYTETTRTAAETYIERNGNCLSFTNMFVAMAREVGLKARFQQVEVPPDWEQKGETYVLNRHINVLVETGQRGQQAVDFNIEDFKTSYERNVVPDRRAEAHYYSNVGVEKLQTGDFRTSFLYLRKGIEVDPEFSPLWVNLGANYSQAGELRLAETSYLEAVRIDPNDMVAISNLGRLYDKLGDATKARTYREMARYHREHNPYYRFYVAREAFLRRDYKGAMGHLDYAIRKRPTEDSFYFLRGIVELQLGKSEQARIDLQKAESISTDDVLKRNYHSKMELLMRDQSAAH